MSDFITGSAPGAASGDDGDGTLGGGSPPRVLLAALGAAALIAVTILVLVAGSGDGGGGSRSPLPVGSVGVDDPGQQNAVADGRVLLTVAVEGGGSGRVTIEPRGVSCTETCEHQFITGSRVTLTFDAADGSRFEGWDDACSGDGRCTFVMDRERSVTATFEGAPAALQCADGEDNDDDGLIDSADPGCANDDTEAPDNRSEPARDCGDGRDNDGDGLVDYAQDPGCDADGTEAGGPVPPVTTSPVPPPPVTTPPAVPPPPPPTTIPGTKVVSECSDGRDNDGDGLTDRPADPGCDADGTEAGG